jgi:hypothetical protein
MSAAPFRQILGRLLQRPYRTHRKTGFFWVFLSWNIVATLLPSLWLNEVRGMDVSMMQALLFFVTRTGFG